MNSFFKIYLKKTIHKYHTYIDIIIVKCYSKENN